MRVLLNPERIYCIDKASGGSYAMLQYVNYSPSHRSLWKIDISVATREYGSLATWPRLTMKPDRTAHPMVAMNIYRGMVTGEAAIVHSM